MQTLFHLCFSAVPSPPPFHKHQSRFEREQKIRVGSVDAYRPGETTFDGNLDRLDIIWLWVFFIDKVLYAFSNQTQYY